MINVGSGNFGGGSGGGDLWKFVGGVAPDEIELNAGAGVTGIQTSYTLDPKNALLLINALISFFRQIDANRIILSGISGDEAVMTFFNSLNGATAKHSVSDLAIVSFMSNGALQVSNRSQLPIAITQIVDNNGSQTEIVQTDIQVSELARLGLEVTETIVRKESYEVTTNNFGNVIARLKLSEPANTVTLATPNGLMSLGQQKDGLGAGIDIQRLALFAPTFALSLEMFASYIWMQFADDPLGANNRMQAKVRIDRFSVEYNDVEVFSIENVGRINLNQNVSALGNDNLPFEKIPIWFGGVLQGYIPLLNDPGTAHYNTPTATAGTGAGAGATVQVDGDDYSGRIIVNTAGIPAASAEIVKISFAAPFVLTPIAVFSPGSNITAFLTGTQSVYVFNPMNPANQSFSLLSGTVPLVTGTQYVWMYNVQE